MLSHHRKDQHHEKYQLDPAVNKLMIFYSNPTQQLEDPIYLCNNIEKLFLFILIGWCNQNQTLQKY